jgi:hypothetical protein
MFGKPKSSDKVKEVVAALLEDGVAWKVFVII